MKYLKERALLYSAFFIAADFDGVLVPKQSHQILTAGELLKVAPISEGVVEVLNDNIIGMILTGRRDLEPVLVWLRYYAPEYRGEVASAMCFGESKAKYLLFRGVDVFVTDEDEWYEDLLEWEAESGGLLLVFDEERDGCLKRFLLRCLGFEVEKVYREYRGGGI